jgi:hypothetical protein
VPIVSERLCHARTSTTVNIYAHAMPVPTATPPTSSPTSSINKGGWGSADEPGSEVAATVAMS